MERRLPEALARWAGQGADQGAGGLGGGEGQEGWGRAALGGGR